MPARSISALPSRQQPNQLLAAALLALPLYAASVAAVHAGAAIGWAEAVGVFSADAVAMGALAVVLGIVATGAILMFGITGLVTTVVMVCLGGALMANADAVAAAVFGAGGGGGSVLLVVLPTGGA